MNIFKTFLCDDSTGWVVIIGWVPMLSGFDSITGFWNQLD